MCVVGLVTADAFPKHCNHAGDASTTPTDGGNDSTIICIRNAAPSLSCPGGPTTLLLTFSAPYGLSKKTHSSIHTCQTVAHVSKVSPSCSQLSQLRV